VKCTVEFKLNTTFIHAQNHLLLYMPLSVRYYNVFSFLVDLFIIKDKGKSNNKGQEKNI